MISWENVRKTDPTLPRYGTDFMTRESRLSRIAPSSRHREVEQLLALQHEDVSVRQLGS